MLKMLICSVFHVFKYAWRNFFPLAALAAGAGFVVLVPQAHEILANLFAEASELKKVDETRFAHMAMFLGALVAWALLAWYAMRLLSSTEFPHDPPPRPEAEACARWLNEEAPRLAPLLAVATVACASSVFLQGHPTAHWIAFLAAGVAPLTWGTAWALDRLVNRVFPSRIDLRKWPYPVPFGSLLATAAAAAAGGWFAWSGSPGAVRGEPWAWQYWVALVVTLVVLASVVPWWRGRASRNQANRARQAARKTANRLMVAAFLAWSAAAVWAGSQERGLWLPLTILLLAAAGQWLTSRRRGLLKIAADPATPQPASAYLWPSFKISKWTLGALFAVFVVLVAFSAGFATDPLTLGTWMGTLAVLFAGLALWSFFGSLWVYLPKLRGLPALGAVPFLLMAAVELAGLAPDYALRDTGFKPAASPRPALGEHFAQWRKANLQEGQKGPVFFVAAAGGGLRAAFWTANMLAAADDATCGEFGRHVYAYSGVSGGSLGIAAYLAQRQVWAERDPKARCARERRKEITRLLGRDFLAPVAGSLLFAELPRRLLPLPLENDRGTALAKSWSEAWNDVFGVAAHGRFDEAFLDAFAARPAGKRAASPAVFLNSTAVDSGRRVIVSNVAYDALEITDSIDLLSEKRRRALKTSGLTLREAVLNSARFTYVSPPGEVRGCYAPLDGDGACPQGQEKIWDRVVDGGYFENSGLATLSDVVHRLMAKPPEGAGLSKDELFIIVIDNSSQPVLACRPARSGPASRGRTEERPADVPALSGMTAPVEAFLHVREARARLEVRRLSAEFECERQLLDWSLLGGRETREQAEAEQQRPALGWFLSTRSADWMLKRVDKVATEFPFRLAACPEPQPRAEKLRGLFGVTLPKTHCPGPH